MKSFGITIAFVLAAISTSTGALPTGQTLARRNGNYIPSEVLRILGHPAKKSGYASGSNGGYNSFGNGADEGYIDSVSSREDNTEMAKEFLGNYCLNARLYGGSDWVMRYCRM